MNWLFKDIAIASRILKNDSLFSLLSILVIAVGSGLAIFAFSLSNTIVFKPLAMNDQQAIYLVEASVKGEAELGGKVQYADYHDLAAQSSTLNNIGAYYLESAVVGMEQSSERFSAAIVTEQVFAMTGALPLAGRLFNSQDRVIGSAKTVILGEKIAQQVFRDSTAAVGKNIRINGEPHQVVGVMAQDFEFPVRQHLWLPMREAYHEQNRASGQRVAVIAQFNADQSTQSVSAELDSLAARYAQAYPQSNAGRGFYLAEFKAGIIGESGVSVLTMIMTAAFVVLLLSCVNVASLLSVRANQRIKQTSVQIAMGAPRYRIITQIISEAFVICTLGALLGLTISLLGLQATQEALNSRDDIPFWWQLGLDIDTLLMTFMVILVASLLSSIWPSIQSSEGNFNHVLRDGTRGALGKSAARFSYFVVFIELTLSFVILVYSGLQLAQMDFINSTDYGTRTVGITVGEISFEQRSIDNYGSPNQFYNEIQTRLGQINGVESVALTTSLPGNYPRKYHYQAFGQDRANIKDYPYVNPIYVSDNYLDTFEIKLVAGRMLDSRDWVDGVNNVIIEDKFAEQSWPGELALGKRFRIYDGETPGEWMTVVGVVSHVIYGQVQSNAYYRYSFYAPLVKSDRKHFGIGLKTLGQALPHQLIREAMYKVDQQVPVYRIKSMDNVIKGNAGGVKLLSVLFTLIAIASLILSASCIFAVIAYLVTQRQHEIAVRQALGADDGVIHRLYIKNSLIQYLVASICGLALAYVVSQTVDTTDFATMVPVVFVSVAVLMLLLVLAATAIPVFRTLRKEPYEVLSNI